MYICHIPALLLRARRGLGIPWDRIYKWFGRYQVGAEDQPWIL